MKKISKHDLKNQIDALEEDLSFDLDEAQQDYDELKHRLKASRGLLKVVLGGLALGFFLIPRRSKTEKITKIKGKHPHQKIVKITKRPFIMRRIVDLAGIFSIVKKFL